MGKAKKGKKKNLNIQKQQEAALDRERELRQNQPAALDREREIQILSKVYMGESLEMYRNEMIQRYSDGENMEMVEKSIYERFYKASMGDGSKRNADEIKNITDSVVDADEMISGRFAQEKIDGKPAIICHDSGLGELVDIAKKNYSNVKVQKEFCDALLLKIQTSGVSFLHCKYKSEIALQLVVALRKHRCDEEFRQRACNTLRYLLIVPFCRDGVFKYGARDLKEYIEEDLCDEGHQNLYINSIISSLPDDPDEHKHQNIPTNYDDLGKVGFHETVIKAMMEHPTNEEIASDGGKILAGLLKFCTDRDRRETMLEETMGPLIPTLDVSFSSYSYRYVDVLCIIMRRFPCAIPYLKDANGPGMVIATMERFPKDEVNFHGRACEFLSNFAHYNDLQNDCFHAVMAALASYSDDAGTRKGGMSFLVKLLGAQNDGSSLVLQSGHIPFFLELMRRHKEFGVQYVGCTILNSYTYRVEANEPITHSEAAHLLGGAIKLPFTESSEKHLWSVGVSALGNLLGRGEIGTVMDAFLREDCYSHLAAAMEWSRDNHDDFGDVMACTILRNMASSKRNEIKLELATSGCAALIIDCMKRSPGNQAIQKHGCEALGLITINKDPRIFEAISKVDGVNIILDAIDRFPKNNVIFNFGGSAAILTREYEDDKKFGKLDLSPCG